MKASDVMTPNPRTVTPESRVSDAVSIMRSESCGVVPVVRSEGEMTIVGILTDRDVALKACTDGAAGPETSVSVVMTGNVRCVHVDDDLSQVESVMKNAGVHRVPVVEENNRLAGIISLRDIATTRGVKDVGDVADAILEQRPNN